MFHSLRPFTSSYATSLGLHNVQTWSCVSMYDCESMYDCGACTPERARSLILSIGVAGINLQRIALLLGMHIEANKQWLRARLKVRCVHEGRSILPQQSQAELVSRAYRSIMERSTTASSASSTYHVLTLHVPPIHHPPKIPFFPEF